MLPLAIDNAVAGHMRPEGLQLDHTTLGHRRLHTSEDSN